MYSSDETRTKVMNATTESIGKCAKFVIKYCDGDTRKEQLKKLEGVMEECCLLENKYQVYKASHFEIQKMLKQQNKSDGEESDTQKINIREVFNRKVEEKSVGVPSPKKHKKYIAFKNNNKLLLQAEVGNDELMITSSEALNVDPITKQMMTDPIRIKQCGHTFERSSIMSLLKNRRHIKCPLPGCVQKHVTVNDLEENRELKLQLGRALQAKGANPI